MSGDGKAAFLCELQSAELEVKQSLYPHVVNIWNSGEVIPQKISAAMFYPGMN